MQPLEEPIERIRASLDAEILEFVLEEALAHGELAALTNEAGIFVRGVRTGSLEKSELAGGLAGDFYKNPSVALRIARRLDERLAPLDLSFLGSKKEFKAFKASLRQAEPARVARLIWRLSKEEGPEASRALDAVLDVFDERMEDVESAKDRAALNQLVERSKEASRLEASLEEVRRSLKESERRGADQVRKAEEAEKRLTHREDELRAAREETLRLKSELRDRQGAEASREELERALAESAEARARADALEGELGWANRRLERYGKLERVGLFLDAHNLMITARQAHGGDLDFKALMRKVQAEDPGQERRLLVEAYAYVAEDPAQERTGLKAALRNAGFEVRTRPILYRADGTAKGDWDLGMAIEVLERADRLDVVVLGTGDGDFADLARHLKEKKTHLRVEVACFDSPRHTSEFLLKAADRVHRLGPKHLIPRSSPQAGPEPAPSR